MASDPMDWSRGADRTVTALELRVAALLDKPAALFVPTGTMANTLALWCWCAAGETFIVDRLAHVVRSEDDAYARLVRLSAVTPSGDRGHLGGAQLERALRRGPRPSLLWLENTHTFAGGTVAPVRETAELAELARSARLRVHLDGARLWNAAVAADRPVAELAAPADSVTVNLDKGLGCPAGAVLCGPPDLVETARRRMLGLGGVLAQAGMLAACGLIGLSDPLGQIRRDHALAARLAAGLRGAGLDVEAPETNIVLLAVRDAEDARARLAREGVLVLTRDRAHLRFVTHRDVEAADVARAVAVTEAALAGGPMGPGADANC